MVKAAEIQATSRAPLWACTIGKPGAKPKVRLPAAPRTGFALYSDIRGKVSCPAPCHGRQRVAARA